MKNDEWSCEGYLFFKKCSKFPHTTLWINFRPHLEGPSLSGKRQWSLQSKVSPSPVSVISVTERNYPCLAIRDTPCITSFGSALRHQLVLATEEPSRGKKKYIYIISNHYIPLSLTHNTSFYRLIVLLWTEIKHQFSPTYFYSDILNSPHVGYAVWICTSNTQWIILLYCSGCGYKSAELRLCLALSQSFRRVYSKKNHYRVFLPLLNLQHSSVSPQCLKDACDVKQCLS